MISVSEAIEELRKGGLVALPTETVYGLGGRIDREDTLRRIFTVKGRPFFDPLIVHVADKAGARALVSEWPAVFDILTEKFWPGPLTVVAPKAAPVSPLITSGLDTVAIRCPRHELTLNILRELKTPVAAPSANRFGHTSPTTAAHVAAEFGDVIPIVDGGACEIGVESTVVAAEQAADGNWRVQILRPGGVTRGEIEGALSQAGCKFTLQRQASTASPGHLKHHYQPDSPIVTAPLAMSERDVLAAIQRQQPSVKRLHRLELESDPRLAARSLYQKFRELSESDSAIWIPLPLDFASLEWEAIRDRIERAATLTLSN